MANSVTVSAIKEGADSTASSMVQNANVFLNDLKRIADSNDIGLQYTNYDYKVGDPVLADPIFAAATNVPAEPTFPTNSAVRPTDPVFSGITIPDFGTVPELMLAEPILSMPSAPDATLPGAPGNAPELNSAVMPVAPTIVLPTLPTLQALALPEAPAVNLPVFAANAPLDDLLEPTSHFSYDEAEYSSELLDAARIKLMDDLVNGGYGIDTQDEELLWGRARERELMDAETQIQEASRQAAARGMMMPPGALNAIIQRAQAASLEKTSSLSREVALKRADMYVENRKFTLQEVRQTEAMLLQFFNFAQERILNASKYMAEFGIQLFNAKVARFNARLEAYRGAAQVFETQLRGAMAGLEVYKAKVEGARLTVEVQQMYVSLYNAQLQGLHSNVELYRTQMEAAKIFTQVEMSKLDLFRSRVEAYQAQVGAKSAEFGMYEARIRGEMAKVTLYQSSVSAYGQKVQAYHTGVSAKETIVRAQIAAAQLPLEQYKAKIGMYGADVARYQADISATLGINDSRVKKYSIQVDAVAKAVNEKVSVLRGNAEMLGHAASLNSSEAIAQAQVINARAQITASASSSGLAILSQNAAAITGAAGGLVAEITSS